MVELIIVRLIMQYWYMKHKGGRLLWRRNEKKNDVLFFEVLLFAMFFEKIIMYALEKGGDVNNDVKGF